MQRQERLGLASGSPIEMHDSSVLPNKRHTYREEKVLSLVGAPSCRYRLSVSI